MQDSPYGSDVNIFDFQVSVWLKEYPNKAIHMIEFYNIVRITLLSVMMCCNL